jgi:sugar phosphate isomerase/epimerase
MRYGFCANFSTLVKDRIDYGLLEEIRRAEFDFIEFPLMLMASISEREFDELCGYVEAHGMDCDCACNLFPASLRVVGKDADPTSIDDYLDRAFARAGRIGISKLVFGSSPSRDLRGEITEEEGYSQVTGLVLRSLLPRCEKRGVHLVMEPIAGLYADFIKTLDDGMEVVRRVNSPSVTLLADTLHMLNEKEGPEALERHFGSLDHVHVSELERELPAGVFSPELKAILQKLMNMGYDKTISLETMPCTVPGGIPAALGMLKEIFE